MAKRWFGRKSLTLDSEQIFLNTRTLSDLTLNGSRLLTTQDQVATVTTLVTPTLNNGDTVTTFSVQRPPPNDAQVNISLTKNGSVVNMTISGFRILTKVGVAATEIRLGTIAATYRPTYNVLIPCVLVDNTANFEDGFIYILTDGRVLLQLVAGGTFTVEFGLYDDLSVSWNKI